MLAVGTPWQERLDPRFVKRRLRARKWFSWLMTPSPNFPEFDPWSDPEWTPMWWALRRDGEMERAISLASLHPGRFWFAGNEQANAGEANTAAQESAKAAQEFVQATTVNGVRLAPFAAPGEIVHPPGIDWMAAWLDAGAPVPDKLLVHIHFEVEPGQWQRKLDEVEDLKLRVGLQESLPVIVNETCAWQGTQQQQGDWLRAIVRSFKDNPQLEDVYWFCARNQQMVNPWPWAWLLDGAGRLTATGNL